MWVYFFNLQHLSRFSYLCHHYFQSEYLEGGYCMSLLVKPVWFLRWLYVDGATSHGLIIFFLFNCLRHVHQSRSVNTGQNPHIMKMLSLATPIIAPYKFCLAKSNARFHCTWAWPINVYRPFIIDVMHNKFVVWTVAIKNSFLWLQFSWFVAYKDSIYI